MNIFTAIMALIFVTGITSAIFFFKEVCKLIKREEEVAARLRKMSDNLERNYTLHENNS